MKESLIQGYFSQSNLKEGKKHYVFIRGLFFHIKPVNSILLKKMKVDSDDTESNLSISKTTKDGLLNV